MARSEIHALLHPEPHPLKKRIEQDEIRLWQLRNLLGGKPDESVLSRALRGIRPMTPDLENRITLALDRVKGGDL